ncbi:MAG: hypothetical protein LBL51_05425, partial [Synergistaceae bacterium]|nr:hypothetical protein [Synergistaceae bacterium]
MTAPSVPRRSAEGRGPAALGQGPGAFFAVFFFFVCFLVALFALCPPGEAGTAALYRGNTALGDVAVLDGERDRVVSVADAGALLGLRAEVVGEELVLSRGDDRLRVVLNATAAWNNARIVPLYSASFTQGGRWWLDVPSVLTLLQPFAGRGQEDRLRMEEGAAAGAPSAGTPSVTVPPATTPPAVSLQAPPATVS